MGHGGDVISCFEQCDNTQVNNVMCNLYNLGFWMIRFTTTFAALFPWGPNRILAISSPTKIINIVQSIMVLRCFGDPLCEEHRKSCGIQLPCQKKKGFTVHLPIFCKTLNNLFCFPGLCFGVLCIAGVVLGALGDQGTSWALKHYYM